MILKAPAQKRDTALLKPILDRKRNHAENIIQEK